MGRYTRRLTRLIVAVSIAAGLLVTRLEGGTPRITWDPNTLTCLAEGGSYGRVIRLRSGVLLCCFEKRPGLWVRRSEDQGRSWEDPISVVAGLDYGNLANPELLELQDGQLLLLYNERPTDGQHPFSIMMTRYDPGTRSWGPGQRLYAADVLWDNGCWEPVAIQLASAEVQVYFSNENPYRLTNEQEITLLRSLDQGRTWSSPETVCMRPGNRDGMPVPLILDGGRGIAVAIEDNGLSGFWRPAIVYTTLAANWSRAPVGAYSVQRWDAFKTPLTGTLYASAPYLRQMPSGHTILSFQTNAGGSTQPQMAVCIGDEWARDFAEMTFPFDLKPDQSGYWNSLFVKCSDTITAVSGTTVRGIRGLWAIDGHFDPGSPSQAGPADSQPKVLSIWSHSVNSAAPVLHRYYSNGFIDSAVGPAKWRLEGRNLTLTWQSQNPESRVKEWTEQVVLSEDLYSYTGQDRGGASVRGTLSQSLGPHPFLF
jgi:hypothetical protein